MSSLLGKPLNIDETHISGKSMMENKNTVTGFSIKVYS